MRELLVSDDKLVKCPVCGVDILKDRIAVQDKIKFNCPKCNSEVVYTRNVYG